MFLGTSIFIVPESELSGRNLPSIWSSNHREPGGICYGGEGGGGSWTQDVYDEAQTQYFLVQNNDCKQSLVLWWAQQSSHNNTGNHSAAIGPEQKHSRSEWDLERGVSPRSQEHNRPSDQRSLWGKMSLLGAGFIFLQAKIISLITTISSRGYTFV